MNHYVEYGGGLGDIFYQIFEHGSYGLFERLSSTERATVVLITHNPYVRELFDYHPNAGRIDVRNVGYWTSGEDRMMRAKHGLPASKPQLPHAIWTGRFYPSAKDLKVLDAVDCAQTVVFAAGAGLPDRQLPTAVVSQLVEEAVASGLLPVFVGRSYERHGRTEFHPTTSQGLDLVDRLSVPGVAALVQQTRALVCSHSAINMLGWLLRKPQLLLYPANAFDCHITRRDQWSFGINYPECRHAFMDDWHVRALGRELFRAARNRDAITPAQPPMILTQQTLPLQSQAIAVDTAVPRLTPPHEVKYLCWLLQQQGGNCVEIGCNKGMTTRDLANANRDRIIYAVDYFASDGPISDAQKSERPLPDDFCVWARHLPNVVCVHARSSSLNYGALRDVKLIFIDGDHTLEGVRRDTEQAIGHLERSGGGTIVWHDFYEGGPDWVGVRRYLATTSLSITAVENTWLAYAEIKAR